MTEENLCRQEAMRLIAEPELASALVPHGKHTPYRVEKERVLEPCGYRRERKKKKASYVSVCLREGASA